MLLLKKPEFMSKVLLIDDNQAILEALDLLLSLHDIETCTAQSPQAGLALLDTDDAIALVIQDMNFTEDTTSGEEGEGLFFAIRERRPDMPIILMTAWSYLETAVNLVKNGAADYISKPWDDKKLLASVQNLLELGELQADKQRMAQDLESSKRDLAARADLCSLVYQSALMHNLVNMAVKVARTDAAILITGPNGSGKEKIAEIVQSNSDVKDGPFIKVNVGALPNELLEAELFGAEAGAYTGSKKTRIGRFEAADGGTLFLDELGNLSASGQAKLLRVIQTGEFERLGSSDTRRCKVRVISATNADLLAAIETGEFREDLYYRLNLIELKLPTLAERPDDILPLVNHFIGSEYHIEPMAIRAMQSHTWPGNVRELENACQRAMILAQDNTLKLEHFRIPVDESKLPKRKFLVEPSKAMLEQALTDNRGVISLAARQLGLSRQAFYRRMDKHQIPA